MNKKFLMILAIGIILIGILCFWIFQPRDMVLGKLLISPDAIAEITVGNWITKTGIISSTSSEDLSELLDQIKTIPLTNISPEKQWEVMKNIKAQDEVLEVNLFSKDPDKQILGFFVIWPDGSILSSDPKGITDPTAGRIKNYVSKEKYPQLYEWLKNRK